MKIDVKKAWVGAVGLGLGLTALGGVAVAAGDPVNPGDWYDGKNATVVDKDKTAVALKLYDASGNEVTHGITTDPLGAFAAASGDVRAGDTFASLFVNLPEVDTAPGAWPSLQVTGTGKFSGSGAVTAPAALSGKPYVATGSGYTLADIAAAFPNKATAASYAGVYELRLRTSSPTAGVGTSYAAAYVKVTGSSWALTTSPVLGDTQPPSVATSVTVSWLAKLTYGTAASVPVTVTAASGTDKPTGTVRLVTGSTTLSTGTLSAGTAKLSIAKSALQPGSRALKVVYSGTTAFTASESAAKTVVVAKAAPGRPAFKATKKPTAKKAGAATVTVATPAGLATATGKVQVVLKKGKTAKKLTPAALKAGKATVKLPKLPKGTWTVTVSYPGDAHYLASTSPASKLAVRAK